MENEEPDNFYCGLFLTKNGIFIPVTDVSHLATLLNLDPTIFESRLDDMPIGQEINAMVNNVACGAKLIKLFTSQASVLQFVSAYGSKCVSDYVNMNTALSSLLKPQDVPSSFVTQTKLCVDGLNHKLSLMEDLVETYRKDLNAVKTEMTEHLISCPTYNSFCNETNIGAEMLINTSEKEVQFVAFPQSEMLLWMDVDVRQKIITLFNSLINQVEDFPTELALNMWGVRIIVSNDISTKTVQFRQDPPLIMKDPSGYDLYTKILFRWFCTDAIESGRVLLEDYCQNKDHYDALLNDTFFNEELAKILKTVREKTDSYEKMKSNKSGATYNALYYQLLAIHAKPTSDWTIASEALPVGYRLGYDESFEVQSPMLTLIRHFEESKTNTKEFEQLCRTLRYSELLTGVGSPNKKATHLVVTRNDSAPERKYTPSRRGRKPKQEQIIVTEDHDGVDEEYRPPNAKRPVTNKALGFK